MSCGKKLPCPDVKVAKGWAPWLVYVCVWECCSMQLCHRRNAWMNVGSAILILDMTVDQEWAPHCFVQVCLCGCGIWVHYTDEPLYRAKLLHQPPVVLSIFLFSTLQINFSYFSLFNGKRSWNYSDKVGGTISSHATRGTLAVNLGAPALGQTVCSLLYRLKHELHVQWFLHLCS